MATIEQLESQARELSARLEKFDEQMDKIDSTIVFLDNHASAKSIIFTLAPGVYIEKTEEGYRYLMYVGRGIVVEKKMIALKEMLLEQLAVTQEYTDRLTQRLVEISKQADEVTK